MVVDINMTEDILLQLEVMEFGGSFMASEKLLLQEFAKKKKPVPVEDEENNTGFDDDQDVFDVEDEDPESETDSDSGDDGIDPDDSEW